MSTIEVCRIVHDWDENQNAKQRWEARLITAAGERMIARVDYWDEKYRSDDWYMTFHVLWKLLTFWRTDSDEAIRETRELSDNARAKLVAQLMEAGWEPTTADAFGHVTMMQRSKP